MNKPRYLIRYHKDKASHKYEIVDTKDNKSLGFVTDIYMAIDICDDLNRL